MEKEFQLSFVKLDNMLHDYYVKNKENEAFVNQVCWILEFFKSTTHFITSRISKSGLDVDSPNIQRSV